MLQNNNCYTSVCLLTWKHNVISTDPVWEVGKECQNSHHRSPAAWQQHPVQRLSGRSSQGQHRLKSEGNHSKEQRTSKFSQLVQQSLDDTSDMLHTVEMYTVPMQSILVKLLTKKSLFNKKHLVCISPWHHAGSSCSQTWSPTQCRQPGKCSFSQWCQSDPQANHLATPQF